ncbi:hypothetical protein FQA18_17120 [Haloferax volcanii]|uniref:Uncharacterized protein n=1 Tax=Haloferax volcanii TaxID=2246 RepID=A0A558G325_HALVO|nr:hypothetical protein FQA18_17120 [Haloferax volcanii]
MKVEQSDGFGSVIHSIPGDWRNCRPGTNRPRWRGSRSRPKDKEQLAVRRGAERGDDSDGAG